MIVTDESLKAPISCSNASLAAIDPPVLRHLARLGQDTAKLINSIASTGFLDLGGETKNLFRTALESPPEQHVRVQAAFQKHVDNAVSKTVNLPADASPRDVADAYLLAYRLGCKGVTVFRYGSKSEPMLELGLGQTPEEAQHFTKCDPEACRL